MYWNTDCIEMVFLLNTNKSYIYLKGNKFNDFDTCVLSAMV